MSVTYITCPHERHEFPLLTEIDNIKELYGWIHVIQYEDTMIFIKLEYFDAVGVGDAWEQLQEYKKLLEYDRYPSMTVIWKDLGQYVDPSEEVPNVEVQ